IRSRQACGKPNAARVGGTRQPGVPLLRTYPRNRGEIRNAGRDEVHQRRQARLFTGNLARVSIDIFGLSPPILRTTLGIRINYELAAVAGAFADGAHSGRSVEFQVDDAALARGHGIEAEGLAGFAHALRGDARGELQFIEPSRAVIAAIEAHPIVQSRIEPQPAMRNVLERE